MKKSVLIAIIVCGSVMLITIGVLLGIIVASNNSNMNATNNGTTTTTTSDQHEHNYVNNVCQGCGETNPQYIAYMDELDKISTQYEFEIENINIKIQDIEKSIEKSSKYLSEIKQELASLSPNPSASYYDQLYQKYYRIYGNSYDATIAAKAEWANEYNAQKKSLESTARYYSTEIESYQKEIDKLNDEIYTITLKWNAEVESLKVKYEIK